MSSNPAPEFKKSRWRKKADYPSLWVIYGFLLLPFTFLVIFNYIPAVSALSHAFTAWDVGGETRFVGLANFREILTDKVFLQSVGNVFKIGLVMFLGFMTVPFIVAEMIYHLKSDRWNYICRVLVVTPMIVPGVVVFMLWGYIYSDAGILTQLLTDLGLHEWVYGWLSHPKTAIWAVACVGFPWASGFHILIYYAGLANIPSSILEAAEIDGLGPMGRIFRIHIPLILEQVKLLIIFTLISIVNGFELVYLLTRDGGPGYETMVPGLYMYLSGFNYQRMGYACAIGLLMLVFLLVVTLGLNKLFKKADY